MGIFTKIFASLILTVFFCAGALMFWAILMEATAVMGTWSWQQTQCEILSSRVVDKPKQDTATGDYMFEVKYRYKNGGQAYQSDQYRMDPQYYQSYGDVAQLVGKYPAGGQAVCLINPSAPNEAILARDSLFALILFLAFPLVFMGFGGGGLYVVWRRKTTGQLAAEPNLDYTRTGKGRWLMVVFFIFFFLLGSAFLYLGFIGPLIKIVGARDWPTAPCVVISSAVDTFHDSKRDTYSVNILYRYEFQGKEYKSNAYDFTAGSSSGYDGKKHVVDQHPPGSRGACYVNPGNPTEAVLDRDFSATMLWGLLGLPFALIGGGGIYSLARAWFKNDASGKTVEIGTGA